MNCSSSELRRKDILALSHHLLNKICSTSLGFRSLICAALIFQWNKFFFFHIIQCELCLLFSFNPFCTLRILHSPIVLSFRSCVSFYCLSTFYIAFLVLIFVLLIWRIYKRLYIWRTRILRSYSLNCLTPSNKTFHCNFPLSCITEMFSKIVIFIPTGNLFLMDILYSVFKTIYW